MKKLTLGILVALLLLSGCSSNVNEQNVTKNSNQSEAAKNTIEGNNDTNAESPSINSNDKNNLIMTVKSLHELEELFVIENSDKFEGSLEKDVSVYSAYEDDSNIKNIAKFDSSGTILTMLSFGNLLEDESIKKTLQYECMYKDDIYVFSIDYLDGVSASYGIYFGKNYEEYLVFYFDENGILTDDWDTIYRDNFYEAFNENDVMQVLKYMDESLALLDTSIEDLINIKALKWYMFEYYKEMNDEV